MADTICAYAMQALATLKQKLDKSYANTLEHDCAKHILIKHTKEDQQEEEERILDYQKENLFSN